MLLEQIDFLICKIGILIFSFQVEKRLNVDIYMKDLCKLSSPVFELYVLLLEPKYSERLRYQKVLGELTVFIQHYLLSLNPTLNLKVR